MVSMDSHGRTPWFERDRPTRGRSLSQSRHKTADSAVALADTCRPLVVFGGFRSERGMAWVPPQSAFFFFFFFFFFLFFFFLFPGGGVFFFILAPPLPRRAPPPLFFFWWCPSFFFCFSSPSSFGGGVVWGGGGGPPPPRGGGWFFFFFFFFLASRGGKKKNWVVGFWGGEGLGGGVFCFSPLSPLWLRKKIRITPLLCAIGQECRSRF